MILRNRSPQFFKCKKKKLKHMVLRSSADYNHKKKEEERKRVRQRKWEEGREGR